MKRKKVLVITYGFRLKGIFEPIKKIGFNLVIIVTGEKNIQRKEFKRVIEFLPVRETIIVDVFDFWSVYNGIVSTVRKYKMEELMDVEICVSGGTNILTAGAIIASWCTHVKCYHVAHGNYSEIPYVPIEAITMTMDPKQMAVIKAIGSHERDVDQLKDACGFDADVLYDAILSMEREGYVYINRGDTPTVGLTDKGYVVYEFMGLSAK